MLCSAQTQSAPPANTGQTAQGSDAGGVEQPLKPEELTAPSNAALANVAPAGTTAAPASAQPAPATSTTASANPPVGSAPTTQGRPLSQGKGGVFTLKTEVDEVVLHATVVDRNQRLVTDLPRAAFTVYENGQPQAITSFRREDVPVAIGILVDNSGSMRDKRAAVTQAALNFVRSSNPDDRVFIVNFADEPYLDQDFTSSIPKLKQALENIDSRGETALYDAVVAAADHLTKEDGIDKKLDKKVLLIVTDGWDNASSESLEQAIRRVQAQNGPTIYTIGILDEDSKKKGKRALKELAEQTGGVAFFPKDLGEVDSITQQVAHDIRNQYTIGYKKNPDLGPGYRTIKVDARAPGYKDLVVRTRTGYFPGQEKDQQRAAR
ncbi:MAG TPA: VWA domain-containing protein [Terriglobales bacterium]|nr:VWA domain-containing protein [Terriglobales bacterium]